ncbi:hypothetical protein O0V02_03230 [Gordonia amicalis]|uniref:hypothetical protein n=1 Tax=Gordonia amicalis TaxID=89053 RepID=UPI0022A692B0|nr:hypothetical protein [Gordonia amicalis]MCZ0911465.1 hypothetical protein [Gordonia amicalis]
MSALTTDPAEGIQGKKRWSARWVAFGAATLFVVVSLIITKQDNNRLSETSMDDHFDLPMKPLYEPYLVGNNVIATILMTLLGLSGVAMGVAFYRRTRDIVPLMLAISAPLVVFTEVFLDIMGAVYFPWSDTEFLGHAFTLMGRQMPWWIVAAWFGYAALGAFEYATLAKKPPTKHIWFAFGGLVVAAIIFEEILLSMGLYHYYGNHPLVLVRELPWWWEACNPLGVTLAVALGYRLRSYFTGVRALLLLPIMPITMAAAYGFAALPGWIAVNSDYPWLPTQLLGFASIALGFAHFYLILRVILNRDPFDFNYVPPEGEDEFRVDISKRKNQPA